MSGMCAACGLHPATAAGHFVGVPVTVCPNMARDEFTLATTRPEPAHWDWDTSPLGRYVHTAMLERAAMLKRAAHFQLDPHGHLTGRTPAPDDPPPTPGLPSLADAAITPAREPVDTTPGPIRDTRAAHAVAETITTRLGRAMDDEARDLVAERLARALRDRTATGDRP